MTDMSSMGEIPDDIAASARKVMRSWQGMDDLHERIARAILAERERCARLCAETIMCTPYGGTKPTHGRYVPDKAIDEFHVGTGYAVLIRKGVSP